MRRLLISFTIITLGLISYSQTNDKNQVDLSCYLFKNKVFQSKKMEGAGGITNGEGIRFGLQYSRLIKNKIWINTGFGFSC